MNKLKLTDKQIKGIEKILFDYVSKSQAIIKPIMAKLTEPDWMPDMKQVIYYSQVVGYEAYKGKGINLNESRPLTQSEVGTSWRPASDWDKVQGLVSMLKHASTVCESVLIKAQIMNVLDAWENPDE